MNNVPNNKIITNIIGNGDKRIGIVSNQKYKIKEAVELVYCFLKHPFEVVKFIEDEHSFFNCYAKYFA